MRSRSILVFLSALAVTAFLALATGCKDSDTITGTRTAAATPTPVPIGVQSEWLGTFDPMDILDCDGHTPAAATFVQNGTTVTGTLSATLNPCGFTDVAFEGTLIGDALVGTVTGGRFQSGTARGTVSSLTLEITLQSHCPGSACIPGGRMHLRRS